METITIIGWVALLSLMVIGTIRFIIKAIKTERKRKSFTNTIKPGDKVMVPVMDRYYGEVLEVNGDEVKIVVKAPKNRVYPNQ